MSLRARMRNIMGDLRKLNEGPKCWITAVDLISRNANDARKWNQLVVPISETFEKLLTNISCFRTKFDLVQYLGHGRSNQGNIAIWRAELDLFKVLQSLEKLWYLITAYL